MLPSLIRRQSDLSRGQILGPNWKRIETRRIGAAISARLRAALAAERKAAGKPMDFASDDGLADVRFGAHGGLTSDIVPSPKRARTSATVQRRRCEG
jgi:hypothetical protein